MTSPSPNKLNGLLITATVAACVAVSIAHAQAASMEQSLKTALTHQVAQQPESRIGVCVALPDHDPVCVNGDQRFSLQSVVKMFVGAAILEAVENKQLSLDQPITLTHQDMSVFVHPLAALIARDGTYTTTIKDLVTRAINDSDNAACDKLIALLGGTQTIQKLLEQKGIASIRIDRDEKNLQSDIAGLTWKEQYNDPAVFDAARKSVPEDQKKAAYEAYQHDLRDTATPQATVAFLSQLATDTLLSPASNAVLFDIMKQTRTGTDRLRGGLAADWELANKTGTSSTYGQTAAATNDVGILIAPDGTRIPVAVFVADSTATPDDRAAIMAKISAIVIDHYSK